MAMKLKIPYQDKVTLGYSLARTVHFAAQQLSLPFFEFFSTGKTRKAFDLEPQKMKIAYRELFSLLKKDSENKHESDVLILVVESEQLDFVKIKKD
jgi:hypothetical protein